MKAIFNQFRGLGDILFTIPIARYLLSNGYTKVMYPTVFNDLDRHFPDIEFISKDQLKIDYEKRSTYEYNGYIVFPLRFTDSILGNMYKSCMLTKYRYFNLPLGLWKSLTWIRDINRENDLYYNYLKLKDNDQYNLISNTYRTDFNGKINIKITYRLKNVNVVNINGFTLLDWSKMIENATNIHIVSSSILLLVEQLNLKAINKSIYIRRPEESDHSNYSYICTKKYNFMNNN